MKRAVIIADAINGFLVSGNLVSPRMRNILPCLEDLLARETAAGSRLLFLFDNHAPDDPEFRMFPPHCVAGTEETQVVEELQAYSRSANAVLIPKDRYDGFYGTTLEQELTAFAPDEVVLTGVCTDICVLHTAEGLLNRGYRVLVPRACVETYDAPGHDAEEINRFAIGHLRDVLGATIIG